jgi:glycine cleavage system aminomethyltransferase T
MPETVMLPGQAGAVMTQRRGRPAPAHYGSVAAELAVCIARVGLAVRTDLAVLSVAASRRGLDLLVARVVGQPLAAGGAVLEAGTWWCRSDDEVVVVCPWARAARLRREVRRLTGGTLTDLSESRVVLGVVGRRAGAVLAELGVFGPERDPRAVSPFSSVAVAGRDTWWLLEGATSALAIVDAAGAADVWRALDAAGRPYGMGSVGLDSIDRYVLVRGS